MCCNFSRARELENAKEKLENEIVELKQKIKSKDSTHQTLLDEYQALQVASTSYETKLSSLEKENDRLVSSYLDTVEPPSLPPN